MLRFASIITTQVVFLVLLTQGATSQGPTAATNWWQYPFPQNVLMLSAYQEKVQKENLIDSYAENNRRRPCWDPVIGYFGRAPYYCVRHWNKYRRSNGQCNDYDNPAAGSQYYRFGRNIPLDAIKKNECGMDTPNPRNVSRTLLQRKSFIPATSINILVAAWIQFMTHDWFNHGTSDKSGNIDVKLEPNDPDFTCQTMKVQRTPADRCIRFSYDMYKKCKKFPFCEELKPRQTFQNTETHWWDGSQIYGSDAATCFKVRSFVDGKLKLTSDGRLPINPVDGLPITGFNDNWWLGLGMMHILWTKEHNYVCDMLKQQNPKWPDYNLFQTARLIITAVIAKIHTLEWTTAILNNDIAKLGLKSNWYGITLLEIARGDANLAAVLAQKYPQLVNGVPGAVGNPKNIREVPFSLTEEFVAVYRLHPLLPDDFEVRNHKTDAVENQYDMEDAVFRKTESVLEQNSMENLFYSFGNDHPGAMTLHNYPNFLRRLNLPDTDPSDHIDLATIDIVRDRERGIPRYNEFRRLLHLTPISTFEELTTNTDHVEELREVYNNDVEQIDLLVGSLAESPLPSGFGFSDTFFRIFVLMARRRLEADRFFTDDYKPELYTQWGLDYIDQTWMKQILLRHHPSLASNLQDVTNVFIPWEAQTTIIE